MYTGLGFRVQGLGFIVHSKTQEFSYRGRYSDMGSATFVPAPPSRIYGVYLEIIGLHSAKPTCKLEVPCLFGECWVPSAF